MDPLNKEEIVNQLNDPAAFHKDPSATDPNGVKHAPEIRDGAISFTPPSDDALNADVPKPVRLDDQRVDITNEAIRKTGQDSARLYESSDMAHGFHEMQNVLKVPGAEAQKFFTDIGTRAISDQAVFGSPEQNSIVASILRRDGIEYALDPGENGQMQSTFVQSMLDGKLTRQEAVSQAVSQDITYLANKGIDVQHTSVSALQDALRKGTIQGRKLDEDAKIIIQDLIQKETAQRYMTKSETLHQRSFSDNVYDSLERQANSADMMQGKKITDKGASIGLQMGHSLYDGASVSREKLAEYKAKRLEKLSRNATEEKAEKMLSKADRLYGKKRAIAARRQKIDKTYASLKKSGKVTRFARVSTKPIRMAGSMVSRTRVAQGLYNKTVGRPVKWAQRRLMRFRIWRNNAPVSKGFRKLISAPFKIADWIKAKAKKFIVIIALAALLIYIIICGAFSIIQAFLPSFGESSVTDENPVSVMQQAVNYMVRRQNSYRYIISGEGSSMEYKYNDPPYILPSEVHLNGELISTNDLSDGVMHFSTGHEYTAQAVSRTTVPGYKGETEPVWADAKQEGAAPVTIVYKGANGSSVEDTLYVGSTIQQFLGHGSSALSVPEGKYISGWSTTDGGGKEYNRYQPFTDALQPTDGANGIVLYAVYEDEGYQQTVTQSTHTETITMITQDEIYDSLRQYVTGQSVSVVFRYTDSDGNYQYVEGGELHSYTQAMLYKAILCSAVVGTDNDDSDPDIFMAYCGKLLDQSIRSCDIRFTDYTLHGSADNGEGVSWTDNGTTYTADAVRLRAFAIIDMDVTLDGVIARDNVNTAWFRSLDPFTSIEHDSWDQDDIDLAHEYYEFDDDEFGEFFSCTLPQYGGTGNAIADFAMQFIGILPYVWGAQSLDPGIGADCSGFVRAVFREFGIHFERAANEFAQNVGYGPNCIEVTPEQAMPGDIVGIDRTASGGHGHVGIYVGNGMYCHCRGGSANYDIAHAGPGVMVTEIPFDSEIVRIWRVPGISASAGSFIGRVDNYTFGIDPETGYDEFEILCSTVAQESDANYESSLAVISCIMNRADVNYGNYGTSAYEQCVAHGEWSWNMNGHSEWRQYCIDRMSGGFGGIPDYTRQAVYDCLYSGIRNHQFYNMYSTWEKCQAHYPYGTLTNYFQSGGNCFYVTYEEIDGFGMPHA